MLHRRERFGAAVPPALGGRVGGLELRRFGDEFVALVCQAHLRLVHFLVLLSALRLILVSDLKHH